MIVTVMSDKYPLIDELCATHSSLCKRIKTEEIGKLKDYLVQNKNVFNFDVLVVDLDYIDDEIVDIVEAIKLYRDMFSGRLVLIAENTAETSAFIGKVVKLRQYNNILVKPSTNVKAELTQCIFGTGKSYQDNIGSKNEDIKSILRQSMLLNLPEGVQITINIASINGRCGCTTQSLKLCKYLQGIGLNPCYIDEQGTGLDKIVEIYGADKSAIGDVYKVNGVSMTKNKADAQSFNVLVCDMGKLDTKLDSFYKCDVSVICSGAKPWEMGDTLSFIQEMVIPPAFVLYMSASSSEQETIKSIDEQIQTNSVFVAYMPDVWSEDNNTFYDGFIKPKLKEVVDNVRNTSDDS